MNYKDSDNSNKADDAKKSDGDSGVVSLRKSKESLEEQPYKDYDQGEEIEHKSPDVMVKVNKMIAITPSDELSQYYSAAASSIPSGMVQDSGNVDIKKIKTYAESMKKLEEMQNEIVKLYLKIKRCSKDVNASESQYMKHLETDTDKEERMIIGQLDPLLVL